MLDAALAEDLAEDLASLGANTRPVRAGRAWGAQVGQLVLQLPPPAMTSPEYAAAFNDVKLFGVQDGDPERNQIAQFWLAENNTVLAIVKDRGTDADLSDTARLFAQVGMAIAVSFCFATDGAQGRPRCYAERTRGGRGSRTIADLPGHSLSVRERGWPARRPGDRSRDRDEHAPAPRASRTGGELCGEVARLGHNQGMRTHSRFASVTGLMLTAAAILGGPSGHVAALQTPYAPPFGSWVRLNEARPILSPQATGFEARGVFNPAVVKHGDRFVMLYRAQDSSGISRLGYATSTDGVNFIREAEPVLSPEAPYERGGGVEDPRLVSIEDRYYLTYTAYNGKDAQLALATSDDLRRWERKGVILPAYKGRWNVNWTKAGAILPHRIAGKYWMYYMADAKDEPDQMGVASSTDLLTWSEELDRPVLPRRRGFFDSRVVEPGPPPVLTKDGILLVYNGADDRLVYRTGWVLFDRMDPTRVLARSDRPIFEPVTPWEKVGQVPNVVFVEGLVMEPRRWLFYYGGADTFVGVAAVAVPEGL